MKEKLRKEIKEKRKKQTKEENRKKSKEIKEKLFGLSEYMDANTVLFYISYNGEVFSHEMIKEALKDKIVVVPISNTKDETLSLSVLESWDDLEIGSYGIFEPRKECIKEVSIDDIDLIIIPGVAFDLKGNRMGHGKGYYDKLLEKTKATSIGLCFECQIIDRIPTEKHDIPVTMIITEERIIDCNNVNIK
jgi:5-formyltetrahydrofolate cyclo-ligase